MYLYEHQGHCCLLISSNSLLGFRYFLSYTCRLVIAQNSNSKEQLLQICIVCVSLPSPLSLPTSLLSGLPFSSNMCCKFEAWLHCTLNFTCPKKRDNGKPSCQSLFSQGRQFCIGYYLESCLHILFSVFIFMWHGLNTVLSLHSANNKSPNKFFKLIKIHRSSITQKI